MTINTTVTVLGGGSSFSSSEARWNPVVGAECYDLLERQDEAIREGVRGSSVDILSRCSPPANDQPPEGRAGLVVGYVQSGKTLSFTAVAALARDNGYAIVIVIAGTSDLLLQQSRERLTDDLRLAAGDAYERWQHLPSPKRPAGLDQLTDDLEQWSKASPTNRPTILITVMKRYQQLEHLALVLEQVSEGLDPASFPTLIIDDEADQASPNVQRAADKESTTYSQIRRIRQALPRHTFLQYTATPQAPLLISLADQLSPDWVTLLEPGHGYTGGSYFFREHHRDFVRLIPDQDVAAFKEKGHEPPPSLQEAFATFLVGVAHGSLQSPKAPTQRSMLVHPSQHVVPHTQTAYWLRSLRELWLELLEAPDTDADRRDLVRTLIVPAINDLRGTEAGLATDEDLIAQLPVALRQLRIQVVNAAGEAKVPWSQAYAWVLVGGQLLDRGFTVEGLTVTYMPRGKGVGNADTIQQRARFFGYKGAYASLCRAWLETDVADAFTRYVEHEESMRKELDGVIKSGESLRTWRRRFLLDKGMKPTRAAVVRLQLQHAVFGDEWWRQSVIVTNDTALLRSNSELFATLLADRPWSADQAGWQFQHPIAGVSLSNVVELLADYTGEDDDDAALVALGLVLQRVIDDGGDEPSFLVHMQPQLRQRSRKGVNVNNLFEGRNPKPGGYPGDSSVHAEDAVTVQLHRVSVLDNDRPVQEPTAVLAVWVPKRLARGAVVQGV
jgi:hypothetical protein